MSEDDIFVWLDALINSMLLAWAFVLFNFVCYVLSEAHELDFEFNFMICEETMHVWLQRIW